MDLPRSILPLGGNPLSRIGVDFHPPVRTMIGHPQGLPNFFGRVVLTDNFEHLVVTQDGRQVLCHAEWFVEVKPERKTRKGTKRQERIAALIEEW